MNNITQFGRIHNKTGGWYLRCFHLLLPWICIFNLTENLYCQDVTVKCLAPLFKADKEYYPTEKELLLIRGTSSLRERVFRMTLQNRVRMWEPGRRNDLRLGHYLVYGNSVLNQEISADSDFKNGDSLWFLGLEKNITMEYENCAVGIFDNHYFALAFIIECYKSGRLSPQNKMIHIDNHDDITSSGMYFNLNKYLTSPRKVEYLVRNISISNWQIPLFRENICNPEEWIFLHCSQKPPFSWTTNGYDYSFVEPVDLSTFQLPGYEIGDLDIDVLFPVDRTLSSEEKHKVLTGVFPEGIEEILNYLAFLLRDVKVLTIASSPGYIDQPRAICYIQAFLKRWENMKQRKLSPKPLLSSV